MNKPQLDQYLGTYYLLNHHGCAVSTPLTVVSTRGRTGTGGYQRGYVQFADGSTIPATTFLELLTNKKLIRYVD